MVFIYVLWVNYNLNPVSAMWYSFFSGVFLDFYSFYPFGSHMLLFTLFSFSINSIRKYIDLSSFFSRALNVIIWNILFLLLLEILNFLVNRKFLFIGREFFLPFLNLVFFEIFNRIFLFFNKNKKCYVK